jgi:lactobin A/cerein 7B family class IIb bacteriocin
MTMMSDVTTEELTEIEGGALPVWALGALVTVAFGVAFCAGVGIGNAVNDAWGVSYSDEIHCA